jgi:hypothetical protein
MNEENSMPSDVVEADKRQIGAAVKSAVPNECLVLKAEDGTIRFNFQVARKAFGTEDISFIDGALVPLAEVVRNGLSINEKEMNFIGSALVGIAPTNAVEALFASQIIVNHLAVMRMAGKLAHAQTLQQMEVFERMYTRLSRTASVQMEALHKLRHGGQQKVIVQHQHVTVEDGGQAVVGNVTTGGRG